MPEDALPLSRAFDQLRKGDAFATRGRTVTEADVVAFAGQTGDFHPQHVDASWAASTRFGERVAHGMLTLSYAFGLVSADPRYVLGLRRIADVSFTRPVRLGDTIRVEGRIGRLTEIDDATGVAGLTLKVVNQDDQLVCRVRVEILWGRVADESSELGQ